MIYLDGHIDGLFMPPSKRCTDASYLLEYHFELYVIMNHAVIHGICINVLNYSSIDKSMNLLWFGILWWCCYQALLTLSNDISVIDIAWIDVFIDLNVPEKKDLLTLKIVT